MKETPQAPSLPNYSQIVVTMLDNRVEYVRGNKMFIEDGVLCVYRDGELVGIFSGFRSATKV